jgi:hypothetical protein
MVTIVGCLVSAFLIVGPAVREAVGELLPSPISAGHRISGQVHRDPYCDPETTALMVTLEPGGRSVVLPGRSVEPPSWDDFAFDGVADGDYEIHVSATCPISVYPPAAVSVHGEDASVYVDYDPCPPTILVEPHRGPPGSAVTIDGRCYYIHSGTLGRVYFDGELVGELRGDTVGGYHIEIQVPDAASAGIHLVEVRTPSGQAIGSGTFLIDVCAGDCNGDLVVTISELIASVRAALAPGSVPPCAAIDLTGDGMVSIDELVSAVAGALNGCPRPSA